MRLYLASTSPARRALLAQSGIEPVLVSPGVDEEAAGAAAAARLGRALTGPELVSLLAIEKAHAVADAPVAGAPVDGFVFGGDSAFEVDGRLYGKPHEPEVARARWREMLAAGGGTLWSGHCLVDRRLGGRGDGAGGSGGSGRVPGASAASSPAANAAASPAASAAASPAASAAASPAASAALLDADGLSVRGDHVVAVDSARLTFADDMDPSEIDAYVSTGEPLEVAGAFTIDGQAAAYITQIDGAPSAVVGLSLPVLRAMLLQGFGVRWHELWASRA